MSSAIPLKDARSEMPTGEAADLADPVANAPHEILARLILALGAEPAADGRLLVMLEEGQDQRPIGKSVFHLLAGCAMFWLFAYATLRLLV